MAASQAPNATAAPPNTPAYAPNGRPVDDRWVDRVADDVSEVLAAESLDLELIVFYDKVTDTLHAVGYDGAPARYFRSLDGDRSVRGAKDDTPEAASPSP